MLAFADDGTRLAFFDRRPGFESEDLTVIDGAHRAVYLACDAAQSADNLADRVSAELGAPIAPRDVKEVLESLVNEGLMAADGDTYLSLGLRMPERSGDAAREAAAPA